MARIIYQRRVVPLAGNDPAILGDVVVGAASPAPLPEESLPDLVHMLAERRRHREAGMLPDGFLAGKTEDKFGGRIPGSDPKIGIPLNHGQRGMFEVNTQLLLRLANLFVCPFAIGDIARDAEQADHVAVRVAIRSLGGKKGVGNSGVGERHFVGLRSARLHHLSITIHDLMSGLGIEKFGVILAQDIFHAAPQEASAGGIHHQI